MTKITKKIVGLIFGAIAFVAFSFGLVFTMPQVKTAKAESVAVTFSQALSEGHDNEKPGYLQVRMDTDGLTWNGSYNDKLVSELPGNVADHVTVNGSTLTELSNMNTSTLPVIVTMQPAGSFSFIRVWVPTDFMTDSQLYSLGIIDGFSFVDDGTNGTGTTFTSSAIAYSRSVQRGGFTNVKNYSDKTELLTASDVTIGDAVMANVDCLEVEITTSKLSSYSYEIMGSSAAAQLMRNMVHINGKSVETWNTQLIAEDPAYETAYGMYRCFPQNSATSGHEKFHRPIGLYATDTGLKLHIFYNVIANFDEIVITLSEGCTGELSTIVTERVSKTVWTQDAVNITSMLTCFDNTSDTATAAGYKRYYVDLKSTTTHWSKAPMGGCLNEYDPANKGGGQTQMRYIYFNGTSLYDINKGDDEAYESTHSNIASGGYYAPILVTMTNEEGGAVKLDIPTAYTNGKSGHEEIIFKKGFAVYENGVSCYLSNDVVFTNDGAGNWTKEIKGVEIETEVTGIITKANRTDGGTNERFFIIQLSNNDYSGASTTSISDFSSLFGYIDVGGTVISSTPKEPFFNVWGIENSVAFRISGWTAENVQQIPYITIKAGAKFPSYNTQYNGGALTYYVTTEDITFNHDVPNDTWTVATLSGEEYTVTFTVDGATYHTATVTSGATVSAPEAPTKAEDENYTYTFNQWLLDGEAYDFNTTVTSDITLVAEFTATQKAGDKDITSELAFVHQDQQYNGTETYMIKTTNAYWTKAAMQGGCLNEHDPENAGGGQEALKYIYFNGTSLYEINQKEGGSFGSEQVNIVSGGIYAPFLATVGLDGTYSYVQIHMPTLYGGEGTTANENHKSFEVKSGFALTENGVTYKVTQDIKWVNLNGNWVNGNSTFAADTVKIGNLRVDGDANELYKVDIVSESWNVTCNYYDFMYGGNYAEYRKFFFINGVSVYDINTNTDDSEYVYSTFPMTGSGDDSTFAHPVLIQTMNQGGDPYTITLWIHKNYINSLDGEIVVTLGAGYNAFTNGLALAEDVSYALNFTVEIDNGTNSYTATMFQGTTVGSLGTPSKSMTSTTKYAFEGWYDANTDTKLSAETVITADMSLEARFTETTVNLIETDIETATYFINDKNNTDRWFYFTLTEHDYPTDLSTVDFTNDYVKSIGLLDKVTLIGDITLGSTSVTEATLAEIYTANGYGEAIYMNIWDTTNYLGTIAFRIPGVNTITEVVVEEGAFFPSYAYVSGSTTVETYYMLPKTVTAINNNEEGLNGVLVPEQSAAYDIQMAEGAGVRLSAGNDYTTSGLRFETKISVDDVVALATLVDDGVYDNVEFGTLIVPKDYMVGGLFTHEWLASNGFNYIDKIASVRAEADTGIYEFAKEEDGYYSYFLSIVNLKKTNLNREFVGLGYIKISVGEDIIYVYADYESTNARSASFVANAAINDRSEEATDEYDNYIEEGNNYSPYTEVDLEFLKGYITWTEISAVASEALTDLSVKGGVQTITPTTQALAGPYVELVYKTNVNVWGVFTYTDGSKTANEDFYLQAGTTSHKQYLDIFRSNGVGYGMDTSNLSMTSIKFTNAELATSSAPAGEVQIFGLYSQNKTVDMDNQEIYLTVNQSDGSQMTVGAHLGLGGALTYLAKSGIYEGVTNTSYNSGNVQLSTSTSTFVETHKTNIWGTSSEAGYYGHATSSKAADGAVNLINNYDAGRQIQQSWYAQVGGSDSATAGENGYTRAFCKTESSTGKYWPYNPVQAGDVVSNPGQIVDYEITDSYIYVKTRAMDWAKGKGSDSLSGTVEGGVTTKSYMENYYRLKDDGTLTVNNSFVDWNGFTDMSDCEWASTELPAVYPVQTLNYYVTNMDGDGSWSDALEYRSDLASWVSADTSVRQIGDESKVENWFAWANGGSGSAIGLGMYIPNVYSFTSGRSKQSNANSVSANRNSSSNILAEKGLMSNMQSIQYTYQSTYVSNTSYTAPGVLFRMEAYVPIEYSYVLCVNTVDNIRSTFKNIYDNGTVTNAGNAYEKVGLDAWARADKVWTW